MRKTLPIVIPILILVAICVAQVMPITRDAKTVVLIFFVLIGLAGMLKAVFPAIMIKKKNSILSPESSRRSS